ncbi:MAG TPA: cysteine--tRNA ligase [Candidatus Binatia bacterium]|nr:cysteine--tRNA ligase [Candidatus Binatia bacterium]
MIQLTNTLSGRKEPLRPREAGHVRLYWCGVTVYSRTHVGHARAFVAADVLVRHLQARGHRVTFVRNFTDVDDKMIRRAADERITVAALAEREIAAFREDARRLGCLPPTHEPRATEHIALMIALVERLVAKGLAYPVPDGSVYFRVRRFPEYGKLSHRRLEDMEVGEENDPAKEEPHDFALWKGAKPGEPTWPSPWGPGRPGWHLECSAMAAHYLGQPFDIHGGGSDLVFPHHENEIAQSEAAADAAFADLWVHNGMLTFGADKMSKSLGNVLNVSTATERFPGEALRLLYYGTHYRAPLDFGPGRLEDAARSLERLYESLARADETLGAPPEPVEPAAALAGQPSPFLTAFGEAMDDDLNAAKALGFLHDRFRDLNRALDAGDRSTAAAIRAELGRVAAILGILGQPAAAFLATERARRSAGLELAEADIQAAITARNEARKRKDFREADAIRERLRERGVLLEDTPSGTVWKAG